MNYAQLARQAGISLSYAHETISGKRKPSLEMAVRIYDATGVRYGPLIGLTKREIDTVRKVAL